MQRFRGGLVFKARRLLYHSNLGLRVMRKMEKRKAHVRQSRPDASLGCMINLFILEVVASPRRSGNNRNSVHNSECWCQPVNGWHCSIVSMANRRKTYLTSCVHHSCIRCYRSTSLIRDSIPIGTYSSIAQGHVVVLGGEVVSYERGTPVGTDVEEPCEV